MPRSKQLGAEWHDLLSMTTAVGSAVSPQDSRVKGAAELSDRVPLHTAEAEAPNRHDRLVQWRASQPRL
jgi:hypothetical protein